MMINRLKIFALWMMMFARENMRSYYVRRLGIIKLSKLIILRSMKSVMATGVAI